MSGLKPVTVPDVRAAKGQTPLVMVTAYDAPTARIADDAGVDLILVGDSVAMVVLGYDDTLQVTIDDMAHHTAAVARTNPRALIVGDLPWMSYHLAPDDAVANAAKLIRAGARSVKLEGGAKRVPVIEAIVDAEIPVMGHLGLTPQSVHALGGFKVQGRTAEAARLLVDDAQALVEAGVFAIVLECVPDDVARARHRGGAGADDRHRRRRGVRRPGARDARPARARGPGHAAVRAPLRRDEGRRRRGGGALRRRRPGPHLPRPRRGIPPAGRRRGGAGAVRRRRGVQACRRDTESHIPPTRPSPATRTGSCGSSPGRCSRSGCSSGSCRAPTVRSTPSSAMPPSRWLRPWR